MRCNGLLQNPAARTCARAAILACCLLATAQPLYAQQNFWPMADGCTWGYEFISAPLRLLTTRTAHEVAIDGKTYYEGLPEMYGEKWRVSNDSVYGYLGSFEALYFTFNDSVGTVREPWPPSTLEVWVTGKGSNYISPTGSVHNWFSVHIEPRDIPDSVYFDGYFAPTFADGIGIVRFDGWYSRSDLKWWRCGGETYGNQTMTVHDTEPRHGSMAVPPETSVYLQCVADYNLEITPEHYTVTSGKAGTISGTMEIWSTMGEPWGFTHRFTPDVPFPENDRITITLSGAITDKYGNQLDGNNNSRAEGSPIDDFTFWFETGKISGLGESTFSPGDIRVLHIYPNPVSPGNNLVLTYTTPEFGQSVLRVRNILGQEVYRATAPAVSGGAGTAAIPTGTLVRGLYFFTLETRSGNTTGGRFLVW